MAEKITKVSQIPSKLPQKKRDLPKKKKKTKASDSDFHKILNKALQDNEKALERIAATTPQKNKFSRKYQSSEEFLKSREKHDLPYVGTNRMNKLHKEINSRLGKNLDLRIESLSDKFADLINS